MFASRDYREGRDACRRGCPETRNPHVPGTERYAEWAHGFHEAEDRQEQRFRAFA